MNKKGLLIGIMLVVVAALIAGFAFANHQNNKPEDEIPPQSEDAELMEDEDVVEGNGIMFEEEMDGADIVKAQAKEEDFYGTWEATSDMALYLYGNFELTIKDGGKWTGNITEEKMDGVWRMEGNTMHVINEWIDVTLCFTEDGTLVMQRNDAEEGEPEDMVNTVLTRKR